MYQDSPASYLPERGFIMAVAEMKKAQDGVAPKWHAQAKEIQKFGTVIADMPHYLGESVREDMCKQLNVLLADTLAIRDLYKECHWQVSGPTFYQLHLLFDKHYEEQAEMADTIAERVQLLGGITVAMGDHVAELTQLA